MADPFVAEIRIFPFYFAPKGWAWCDGQLLPLSQNTALFSLLGTTYGGDGKSNFALPDLRGRSPMHHGQGPGLSLRDLGEQGGQATVTLLPSEIPLHTHGLRAASAAGDSGTPGPTVALAPAPAAVYGPPSDLLAMGEGAIGAAGGGQPHENRQPFLTLYFAIALQGVFPPRG
jgi:microcystin-dependent protein